MRCGMSAAALMALAGPFLSGVAAAQTTQALQEEERDTVFVMGRIESGISSSDGQVVSGAALDEEQLRTFDKSSVDEALDLIAGAGSSATGGSRNERLIFVRGFDRFQTTLSLDGVRVFLPADNRIDFGRFLTADLAEVQVSKGYVSVLNGPGGVGGAVNLVTRKPSRAFEAEVVGMMTGDGNLAKNGHSVSALIGTRQDQFYAQASGALYEKDSWSLSGDFNPLAPALEDGGRRGNSATRDWRVNLKAGWTPNDTDEYALSYLKLSGEKNAPYHVTDTASTRFWTWPYWDIESIYLLTRTQLVPNLQLRSRVYFNTFENLLSSFDNAAQNTQTLPRAFDSYYDDTAYGANVTLEAKLFDGNTLTGALHYRKDEHNEQQDGFIRAPSTGTPFVNAPYSEPWQSTEEETWSFALEDVMQVGPSLRFVGGLSYDWTNLTKATDVTVTGGGTATAPVVTFTPVNYPLEDMKAVNVQAALVWDANEDLTVHGSISSRTRFPTLFERFSSRFGTAIPNPDIEPERATNYEIGGAYDFGDKVKLEGAVFFSDIEDALVQVPVIQPAPFGTVNQTRNAGSAEYTGAELSLAAQVTDGFEFGGNVTWIDRSFDRVPPTSLVPGQTPPTTGADPTNANFKPQGVPEVKGFVYASFAVAPWLTVTPSLEFASDRWTVTSSSAVNPPRFYETGEYALFNVAANWKVSSNIDLLFAVKNLTDENYLLVDGFPEEGRNATLSLRIRN